MIPPHRLDLAAEKVTDMDERTACLKEERRVSRARTRERQEGRDEGAQAVHRVAKEGDDAAPHELELGTATSEKASGVM